MGEGNVLSSPSTDSRSPSSPRTLDSNDDRRHWLRKLIQTSSNASLHQNDPILRGTALIVAPMVDQSDLPYRLLCRRYGANLAFTPMIHARLFCERAKYREKFWNFVHGMPKEDRPLIAQFCGSNPETLLRAASQIQHQVDGVDINCGCPQGIARKGQYGAYLLEKPSTLVSIVETLSSNLCCPVTVKVRLLPTGLADSLALYEELVEAGAAMLTVHGRNRFQKGNNTGAADWDAIRKVVERVGDRIPVIANGSISNLDDVRECLKVTGADGIMSSEAVLEYPPIFTESGTAAVAYKRTGPSRVKLARDYLDLCQIHPPDRGGQGSGVKCVKMHIHRFLHADLQANADVRLTVATAKDYETMYKAVEIIEKLQEDARHQVEDECISWYMRHRTPDNESADDTSNNAEEEKKMGGTVEMDVEEESAICVSNLFGIGSDDDDDGW